MQTRSSPLQSVDGDIAEISSGKLQCDWSVTDEEELVNFLIDRQAEAGDSATFKPVVWNAAALHLEQFRTKGGPKTANSCSTKWTRVRGAASDIDYSLTTVLAQGEL
jgi:hypothetical protein